MSPEELRELADSMLEHGILEPLVVAETPAGYQIIAGERRWRAARLAGLETVPVVIRRTTPKGMLEMALVENVQRTDLNPIDRAKAFERLMMEFNIGVSEIAKRIGKSPSYISNTIKLLNLPDVIKDGLLSGIVTEGHARALMAIQNTKAMVEAYRTVVKEGGSVRRAEELARRAKDIYNRKLPPSFNKLVLSPEIEKLEADIKTALGNLASVVLKRSRRETKLSIVLKGDLKTTQKTLDAIKDALLSVDPNASIEE